MKQNLDIPLQRTDKNKIMEIKKSSKRSYLEQLQEIFNYYEKISVELFADKVINNYDQLNDLKKDLVTITIKNELFTQEEYFRKIHKAILTKLPQLEFKEMLIIMIAQFMKDKEDPASLF